MMEDSKILSSFVFHEWLPFPRTVLFCDFLKMESPKPFHVFSSLQKSTHQNPSSICQTCFLQPLDQEWHLQVLLSGKSCALILLLQAHRASSDVKSVDFSYKFPHVFTRFDEALDQKFHKSLKCTKLLSFVMIFFPCSMCRGELDNKNNIYNPYRNWISRHIFAAAKTFFIC